MIEKKNKLLYFFKKNLHWILAIFFMSLTFLRLFKIPYYGDDISNSAIPGAYIYHDINVFTIISAEFSVWIQRGRFFPLGFYSYFIFTFFPNLVAYRIFQIIMNLLVLLSFGFLVKKSTGQKNIAALAILFSAIIFQYRYFHEPIIAFHCLLQIVSLYLIWSVYLFIHFIDTNRKIFLFISCFLYACALLTYEISFPFLLLFWLIGLFYWPHASRKIKLVQKISFFFIHTIITLIIFSIPVYLRLFQSTDIYSGTVLSLSFKPVVRTLFFQLAASIPLTSAYSLFKHNRETFISVMSNYGWWDVWVISLFGILIAYFLCKFSLILSLVSKKLCLILGLGFWVLPAILIAVSEKYQTELSFGLGYLPVYVQFFGVIFIILLVGSIILEHIKNPIIKKIVILFFVFSLTATFAITWFSNQTVQKLILQDDTLSFEIKALESGISKSLIDDEAVVILGGSGYMERYYVQNNLIAYFGSGTKIKAISRNDFILSLEEDQAQIENKINNAEYKFLFVQGNLEKGIVLVGTIDKIEYNWDTKEIVEIYGKDVDLFYCGDLNDYLQINFFTNATSLPSPILQKPLKNIQKPFYLDQESAYILDLDFLEENLPIIHFANTWMAS